MKSFFNLRLMPFYGFICPIASFYKFALFYGGNSAGGRGDTTSASTDSSSHTTVSTTNQQVGASEGSTAFGANSTVNITSSDSAVVAGAFDFGGKALDTNLKATQDALFFASKSGSEANALVSKVLDKNPTPTNDNVALLQGVSSVVSANLAAASKTADSAGNKNLVVSVSVIGAILAGLFLFQRGK